ncbi:MAG: beta-phosphoglucomutase [Candidatus Faecousia sp.]|nr:beta-phosphoglucomutase [Candidatus Faecousia sp.]
MGFRGIIFDLDGVIVSTDEQHYLGWQALADRLGIPFSREVNSRFRGVSRMACMNILEELGGKHYTDSEKIAYADWKNEYYRKLLAQMSSDDLSQEVRSTLDALRARGLKLAVGSSSKNAKFILQRIGLSDYFDAVSDGTNISRSKPDPEVFLKAAEYLGLAPSDCLVVEDAVSGVEAAHAGGMKAATVGDAAGRGCGDFILSRFADLLKYIS